MKFLLVDDDINIFNLLKTYARPDEELFYHPTIGGVKSIIEKEDIRLLLLDINLGDENGLRFFSENKNYFKEKSIFVFFISQNQDIKSKLEAFEFGAQDYIIKPFEPLEVMARVRSRLASEKVETLFKKGDLVIDVNANSASIQNEEGKIKLELSATEFKLLCFLARREDQVFNRQQLLDQVWSSDKDVSDRTVDQHISKLRKKMKSKIYGIKTSFSLGYSFTKL